MVVPIKMRLYEERSDMIVLMVIAIVISIGLTDTMINQVSDFLSYELISDFGIATFVCSAIILGISQFIILRYVDRKISYLPPKSSSVKSMHRIVVILQYVLLVIITIIIIQIVITSQYSTYTLFAITAISYSLNSPNELLCTETPFMVPCE
jgi:C4-dicarboxylate transporter